MALTALPLAGEIVSATKWQALFTEARTLGAVKTSNQIKNNNNTLGNDNELFVTVAANATYIGELVLFYTSGTTPDFKAAMTLPSGASGNWGGVVYSSGGTLVTFGTNTLATGTAIGGLGSEVEARFEISLTTSSTSGTARVQWAQNTANATDTTVFAGSYLRLHRIA